MEVHIQESLLIIIFKEKEFINGLIKENILEIGKIIKWMGMEFLLGKMDVNTKVSIVMIGSMDMVNFFGQMVVFIKVSGKMEDSMAKGYIEEVTD